MTTSEIASVIADVECGAFSFHVWEERGRPILQVRFQAPDLVTGEAELQHARKWFLSPHMTRSEVVTTALKAVLTAVEHETREAFRYRGRPVFGPHIDVEALWALVGSRDNLDMRTGRWVAIDCPSPGCPETLHEDGPSWRCPTHGPMLMREAA